MIENYDKTTQRAMRQKRPIGFMFCESKRCNRVIDISCTFVELVFSFTSAIFCIVCWVLEQQEPYSLGLRDIQKLY